MRGAVEAYTAGATAAGQAPAASQPSEQTGAGTDGHGGREGRAALLARERARRYRSRQRAGPAADAWRRANAERQRVRRERHRAARPPAGPEGEEEEMDAAALELRLHRSAVADAEEQRSRRARAKAEAEQLSLRLEDAAAELAALRLEREALSQENQALGNLNAYTEEVMDTVIAAHAAERARQAAEREGAPSAMAGPLQLASAFASMVVKLLPGAAGLTMVAPSAAQIRRAPAPQTTSALRPPRARLAPRARPAPAPSAPHHPSTYCVQIFQQARHVAATARRLRPEVAHAGAAGGAGEGRRRRQLRHMAKTPSKLTPPLFCSASKGTSTRNSDWRCCSTRW